MSGIRLMRSKNSDCVISRTTIIKYEQRSTTMGPRIRGSMLTGIGEQPMPVFCLSFFPK